ncbi:uncharacterized protein LOC130613109 isoform X2 [Hydractinia symbiolongicarpus]|uniref:uncharacterized protein LOC130613109 isoform X2 n=1 Tax=Hydractinia symbiolongicarpus TaxID=13093 RepID=UPI00254FC072|nr:uncharacterized protein LOC130613109 isoform X2 [Hydractinia symbiolongicarpus]
MTDKRNDIALGNEGLTFEEANMKKVLECLTVFFLTVIFCLWMVSMTTRSWRGNPNFKPPIPGLTIAPYDVHHGLWYRCVKPDGTCEKLKDDPNDTTDTTLRGNVTRGLLAAAILCTYLSAGILLINVFIKKEKRYRAVFVACLILQLLALISGFAAMINFKDFFKTPNDFRIGIVNGKPAEIGSIWSEYRYSYNLGWAGAGLMFLPIILTIIQLVQSSRD